MSKIRKPGSGRKKGSVSFAITTLAELNRVLKPDAKVIVSRKFAERYFLQVESNPTNLNLTPPVESSNVASVTEKEETSTKDF
jgi:hypothetical protein